MLASILLTRLFATERKQRRDADFTALAVSECAERSKRGFCGLTNTAAKKDFETEFSYNRGPRLALACVPCDDSL